MLIFFQDSSKTQTVSFKTMYLNYVFINLFRTIINQQDKTSVWEEEEEEEEKKKAILQEF